MGLYIEKIVKDSQVQTDIKALIPDAGLRRRMSRVIKMSVSTAVECIGGIDGIGSLDAIITATGYGCLADSEKFLRNVINDKEELLNPTPFIQSTFNTVGGQIALLSHNHCYNMTYVNRGHSFEDALLDGFMRAADGDASRMLIGAFDEKTDSQHEIMRRMGTWRKGECGEGAVFVVMTSGKSSVSIAEVTRIDFPESEMSAEECADKYGTVPGTKVLWNSFGQHGLFPTASAMMFSDAVEMIRSGAEEVVIYNGLWSSSPAVTVLKRCIG